MPADFRGHHPLPGLPEPAPEPPPGPGADGPPVLAQEFDAGSLYAVRSAVAAYASAAGLPPQRTDDAVVAVHELAANAIRHGAGHGRLRLWVAGATVYCQVADDGAARAAAAGKGLAGNGLGAADGDGAAVAAGLADPRWRPARGHGLWLVEQVADWVSLDTGPAGTIVTISFALAAG
jgi:anti-sigma regulatory factor (Ser/Thr protein kinase)